MDLTDRVALVVGGAGHLGRTAVMTLAELGASVAVADIDDVGARRVAEVVSETQSATHLGVDLADPEQVRSLPIAAVDVFGRLDIVILTAGYVGTSDLRGWTVDFEDQQLDTWRASLRVNLDPVFLLAQSAAPHLAAHGNGAIVLFSSIYGIVGPDLRLYEDTNIGSPAAYAAAKGAIVQMTRWLSTVLAPDVRINAISPGGVQRGQSETFIERYTARTPLRRMATEEDLKGAIGYLASDASAYVTGQNLVVDGGWTAW